MKSENRDLRD
jgi:hypothetical protein